MQPNESDLLKRLYEGDIGAFNAVFDQFWQPLFVYAFNVLKDKDAAEDVVQDLFSQIWQHRRKMQINTSLKGYLFTATHYRVLKEIRYNNRIQLDTTGLAARLDTASPESALSLKELNEQVGLAVQALPERCRTIYLLSREEHRSHKEIAAQLGISVKTVEAQLTIALRRIRRQLGNHPSLKLFFLFL